jgi:hypothetical protein
MITRSLSFGTNKRLVGGDVDAEGLSEGLLHLVHEWCHGAKSGKKDAVHPLRLHEEV